MLTGTNHYAAVVSVCTRSVSCVLSAGFLAACRRFWYHASVADMADVGTRVSTTLSQLQGVSGVVPGMTLVARSIILTMALRKVVRCLFRSPVGFGEPSR